ncbi:hypothetical protein MFLO_08987 [Listeria floridensis FSL S10-1187]|uniref:Uncharacterized protein n=1 Tax=Listeria floridensis FSL S10-1187 TaxID=1265817 RepID=A0ABP3AXG0_9LIST|nr:O-antigen ligase family protein [Listeria floridensis]EUJ31346.1 hypothetical protein MFLO_08987 [Listeria floridensis FSL S10-1187]
MDKHVLDSRMFIGFIVIFPLIDFLNGFFLSASIPIPVGVLYRLLFFLFLIAAIFFGKLPKTKFTLLAAMFILGNLILFMLQSLLLENPLSWITKDLSVFIKYFLWVLIPYYIYERRAFFTTISYEKIFLTLSFFFTICLLIPYLLGVGNQTYDNSGAGYKGFFFANNDTSFAFMISITFTAQSLLSSLRQKWNFKPLLLLMLFFGNIICLLLVGTKTGILYGAAVSFICCFSSSSKSATARSTIKSRSGFSAAF